MPELVWFITGCSSGLGQQLTRAILARGDKVIATARKLQSIKHLESEGAAVLQLDVTDDSAAVDSVVREAIGIYGKIDVLVNNAGYVAIGLVETTPYVLPTSSPHLSAPLQPQILTKPK
jgi:NAD(P)-dependent dehydrogenase (short-subunit alcohol dehydrogenase family)